MQVDTELTRHANDVWFSWAVKAYFSFGIFNVNVLASVPIIVYVKNSFLVL